jgi:hypothetical protein
MQDPKTDETNQTEKKRTRRMLLVAVALASGAHYGCHVDVGVNTIDATYPLDASDDADGTAADGGGG